MIAQLTKNERLLALYILGALVVVGLAMAGLGRGDPLGIHGGRRSLRRWPEYSG